MTIGEQIKKIRQEKGLSQKELGRKLNVSQQMIGQWETGKSNPKLETINNIAAALGISVRQLYPDFSYEEWKQTDTYTGNVKRYEVIKRGVMAILSFEYPEIEEYVYDGSYFYSIIKDGQRKNVPFSTLSAIINYLIHIMPSLYELADQISTKDTSDPPPQS